MNFSLDRRRSLKGPRKRGGEGGDQTSSSSSRPIVLRSMSVRREGETAHSSPPSKIPRTQERKRRRKIVIAVSHSLSTPISGLRGGEAAYRERGDNLDVLSAGGGGGGGGSASKRAQCPSSSLRACGPSLLFLERSRVSKRGLSHLPPTTHSRLRGMVLLLLLLLRPLSGGPQAIHYHEEELVGRGGALWGCFGGGGGGGVCSSTLRPPLRGCRLW